MSSENLVKQNKFKTWFLENKTKGFVLLGASILLLIGIIISIFAVVHHFNSILPKEAQFHGVSLAGMDQEKVEKTVNEQINSKINDANISLMFNNEEHKIKASDYGFRFDGAEVFKAAKSCNYKNGEKPQPEILYNKEALSSAIKKISDETTVVPVNSSHEISGSNLIVKAGTPGVKVNIDDTIALLVTSVKDLKFDAINAPQTSFVDENVPINIDNVYSQVHKKVEDASYSINDAGVLTYKESIKGVDFDTDKAKTIVTDVNSGEYTIPLNVTQPSVTAANLKQEHDSASCPATISTYTTKFSAGAEGRNFNIAKAAAAINGTVLYPGEAFSAIKQIGPASKAQGYKDAAVYTPNGTEQGAGGGVCQVSTTAFLAAEYAHMNVTQRHNHSYTVGYVPPGLDASFSSGGTDLKFKNTYKNPVKVVASTTATSITVSIMGDASDANRYKVTLSPETIYNNESGRKVVTKRTVALDGNVVENTQFTSVYKVMPNKASASGGSSNTPNSENESEAE